MKNEELMRLLARRQKRNRKLLTAGRFLIGILLFLPSGNFAPDLAL